MSSYAFLIRLLVASSLIDTARADWWDGFSNNLATDLSPLLALFGEKVTMQFLSESTSWLDNFIFAMAPLGVVTAVVSAIRVCGGPGLRAFIGRAQEGGGIAEAELCSSTSRDVCELYHNGAIVRVFGRPKILEVVHDREATDFYYRLSQNSEPQKPRCGIYTFREYIEETEAGKTEWKECGADNQENCSSGSGPGSYLAPGAEPDPEQGTLRDSGNDHNTIWKRAKAMWGFNKLDKARSRSMNNKKADKRGGFAPNPNLSFNIGIKKYHQSVSWIAAGIGLVVQASVIIFGGLATYYWQWEKDDARPQGWAFPLMAAGTLLLSCGMFGCAFIVERSTEERFFYKSLAKSRSSVYVTQPGNQTIGDQTYDSFAFSDTSPSSEPLESYVTSWKVPSNVEDQITVWFSIGLTTLGFGLQFTGLRAMHSSVSVVLLAAILIMSTVRSSLRTGRLRREQNLLHDRPDQVEGHELDWLAIQVGRGNSWSVISQSPVRPQPGDNGRQLQKMEEKQFGSVEILELSENGRVTISAFGYKEDALSRNLESVKLLREAEARWLSEIETSPSSNQEPKTASRLFHYRSRLAELTSKSLVNNKSKSSTEWDDNLLPLRQQAHQLKKAIESAAGILITPENIGPAWKTAKSFACSLDVVLPESPSERNSVHQIHIFLRQQNSKTTKQSTTWEVDQNCLEAILGLWIWSINSNPTTERTDGTNGKVSEAAKVLKARVIAAGSTDKEIDIAERNFKYWAEDLPDTVSRKRLENKPREQDLGANAIWQATEDTVSRVSPQASSNCLNDLSLRIFGWSSPEASCWEHTSRVPEEITVLLSDVKHSIPSLCSQEIYGCFIGAMASITTSIGGRTELIQRTHGFCLTNDVVTRLVESVRETGLGSRQDAYAILIPTLSQRAKLPSMMELLPEFFEAARKRRQTGQLQEAESILKQAWSNGVQAHPSDPGHPNLCSIILELGELYRNACAISLRDPDMPSSRQMKFRQFGLQGISQFKFRKESPAAGNNNDTRNNSDVIDTNDNSSINMQEVDDSFSAEIQRHSTSPAFAEVLCRYSEFKSKWEASMLEQDSPADEVINAIIKNDRIICLLKLSQFRDGLDKYFDDNRRTILSWASERGWPEVVKSVLEVTSKVDSEDGSKRTPLSYAAEHGHDDVVDLLIRNQAFPAARDFSGRTPLSHASEHGHIRIMRRLMDEPEAAVYARDQEGRSPLHWAAANGQQSAIDLLLERNADIEATDERGLTPFLVAAIEGKTATAEYLMDLGAKHDPNLGNDDAWKRVLCNGSWHPATFLLRTLNQKRAKSLPGAKKAVVILHLFPKGADPRGSIPFHIDEGADFKICEMKVWRSEAHGRHTFSLANEDTLRKFLKREYDHQVCAYEFEQGRLQKKDQLFGFQYGNEGDKTTNVECGASTVIELLLFNVAIESNKTELITELGLSLITNPIWPYPSEKFKILQLFLDQGVLDEEVFGTRLFDQGVFGQRVSGQLIFDEEDSDQSDQGVFDRYRYSRLEPIFREAVKDPNIGPHTENFDLTQEMVAIAGKQKGRNVANILYVARAREKRQSRQINEFGMEEAISRFTGFWDFY